MVTEIYDLNLTASGTEMRRLIRRTSAERHEHWKPEREVKRAIEQGWIPGPGDYAVVKYSPAFLDSMEMYRVTVAEEIRLVVQ